MIINIEYSFILCRFFLEQQISAEVYHNNCSCAVNDSVIRNAFLDVDEAAEIQNSCKNSDKNCPDEAVTTILFKFLNSLNLRIKAIA